ncbi:MAG: HPF/RaiA family ribosome-associated protein, partial [Chloroflexi bacterium]|nr:HPF/RaiA family ribosome-associated protein [Chloroflexota bacterium]
MKTIVKGKNIEVPDRVRDYAVRKMERLDRILDDRSDAVVEFS